MKRIVMAVLMLLMPFALTNAVTVHDYTNVTIVTGHCPVIEGSPGATLVAYTGPIGLGRGGTKTCLFDDTWTGGQFTPTPEGHANAFDRLWFQIIGFTASATFDLGRPCNRVYIALSQDHGPYPEEALEYRVLISKDMVGWKVLPPWTPIIMYTGGWSTAGEPDGDCNGNGVLNDDYTALWQLPSAFRYVCLVPIEETGPYNEPEIDAVLGVGPEIDVDIKPQSCPNPLNIKSAHIPATTGESVTDFSLSKPGPDIKREIGPVLPVAILGTAFFDVTLVDPSTVRLEGAGAKRWSYEDVSTPMPPGAEECACQNLMGDGFTDLVLIFDRSKIIDLYAGAHDGQIIPLVVTASLLDGTAVEGQDCVLIRHGREIIEPVAITDPDDLNLSNNPNPFNPATELRFTLPIPAHVVLEVYNVTGQRVAALLDDDLEAGDHAVLWDASGFASGVYLYRVQVGEVTAVKKMVLVK